MNEQKQPSKLDSIKYHTKDKANQLLTCLRLVLIFLTCLGCLAGTWFIMGW